MIDLVGTPNESSWEQCHNLKLIRDGDASANTTKASILRTHYLQSLILVGRRTI